MATIKDVARLAGVSTATVSRALNNVPTVDAALTRQVQEAAATLGYRPNGVARSLRRQRTDVLALIISDIGNSFFTSVARGVEDVAQLRNFSVILCNSDEDPDKEAKYLAVAQQEQVAGVILSPNHQGADLSALERANIPICIIDRPVREPVDMVLVESRRGAREGTAHLFAEGWTRPACVTGPTSATTAQERLQGYLAAWRSARRRSTQALVRHADYRAESGRAAASSLLDQPKPPDSFFVANSSMALGVLDELAHRGLRAGHDLGLVAFDDAPWAPFVAPPLSVVAQPAYEVGTRAAELLTDRIESRANLTARIVTLPTKLVVRASSQRDSIRSPRGQSRDFHRREATRSG